jgi:hypothetical protein
MMVLDDQADSVATMHGLDALEAALERLGEAMVGRSMAGPDVEAKNVLVQATQAISPAAASPSQSRSERVQAVDHVERLYVPAYLGDQLGRIFGRLRNQRPVLAKRQIMAQVSNTKISATFAGNVSKSKNNDHTGLIESIEDEGWVLQDIGYVFQETASDSKSKAFGSGERTAVSGNIMGMYLFKVAP